MQDISKKHPEESSYFLYIHTPFCGTCHVAKSMLSNIELAHNKDIFYEMNASYYPEFMQQNEVKSVPCLLIMQNDVVQEKVYAFQSIPNIYKYLLKYNEKILEN